MTVIYNMSIDRADKPWIGDRRFTELKLYTVHGGQMPMLKTPITVLIMLLFFDSIISHNMQVVSWKKSTSDDNLRPQVRGKSLVF